MAKEAVISVIMVIAFAIMLCVYYAWEEARKKEVGFRVLDAFRRSKVELAQIAIGILAAAVTWVLGQVVRDQDVYWTYKWQVAVFFMIPIAYIDLKKRIIPNKLLIIILAATLFVYIAQIMNNPSYSKMVLLNAAVGGLLGGGVFVVASVISRNGVGAGDIKLYFVLGLLLAFRGIFNVLLFSTIISFLVAIGFLAVKKKSARDELPLAPFTLFGVVLSIALGA